MYFEQNEKDIEQLLEKGKVFYKFTKSEESFKNVFNENFYTSYPENSIINANGYHGLAFCDDISKLLACIGYGDQLTQVIVDKDSKYFDDIIKYTYKEPEEYKKFSEFDSFTIQTGKNYSLKDPSVINEILQQADGFSVASFIKFKTLDNQTLDEIYTDLGFMDSANFIKNVKTFAEEKYSEPGNMDEIANKIKRYANSLITERNFSFEKAETEYDKNPTDRRREPMHLAKETEDFYSLCDATSFFLHTNHFTKENSMIVMKAMLRSEKMTPENVNKILPRFTPELTKEQLKQIYHFCDKNKTVNEIMDFIDKVYEKEIPVKKLSLIELLEDAAKNYMRDTHQKSNEKFAMEKIDARFGDR